MDASDRYKKFRTVVPQSACYKLTLRNQENQMFLENWNHFLLDFQNGKSVSGQLIALGTGVEAIRPVRQLRQELGILKPDGWSENSPG